MKYTITVAKPAEGLDGERAFRVSGVYLYGLLVPPHDLTLPTMTSPESLASNSDNAIPNLQFQKGMLGTGGTFFKGQ